MNKTYQIFVYPEADTRLLSHIKFLAQVSQSAAEDLYNSYKQALDFLATNPFSCSTYYSKIQTDTPLRSKLFYKRYKIIFEIVDHSIYIYDIQDSRQDEDKNFL